MRGVDALVVTVSDLLPGALQAVPPPSRRTYGTGLRRLASELGPVELDAVRLADLRQLRDRIRLEAGARTVTRARERGRLLRSYDPDAYGRGAAENFVSSVRFFFNHARAAGLITVSPAADLRPPRRPEPPERPLEEAELAAIWHAAVTTGKDRELDYWVLTFLRHTGCRQEGCLNLAVDHLHPSRRSVSVTEKYGHSRELPLCAEVLTGLSAFARARGGTAAGDPVFRYRSGVPLTRRHFNALFDRIDRHLRWTEPLDVAAHWIRHTTLADIAAASDVRVAQAYAGHKPESLGVIGRYTKVTFADLVDAYEAVFGPRA